MSDENTEKTTAEAAQALEEMAISLNNSADILGGLFDKLKFIRELLEKIEGLLKIIAPRDRPSDAATTGNSLSGSDGASAPLAPDSESDFVELAESESGAFPVDTSLPGDFVDAEPEVIAPDFPTVPMPETVGLDQDIKESNEGKEIDEAAAKLGGYENLLRICAMINTENVTDGATKPEPELPKSEPEKAAEAVEKESFMIE